LRAGLNFGNLLLAMPLSSRALSLSEADAGGVPESGDLPIGKELESREPPMERHLHVLQMIVLLTSLTAWWHDRSDYFASGNITIYYKPKPPKGRKPPSRYASIGPDFFVVRDTNPRERKSWMVDREGGKYPDFIVEILSKSTWKRDRGLKKQIYQDLFRTPDYFLFDPDTLLFEAYHLEGDHYVLIQPDEEGLCWSEALGLYLGVHDGMLRFFTPDRLLIATPSEAAEQERKRADQEHVRAEQAQELAEYERRRVEQEQARVEYERRRVEQEQARAEQAQKQAEYERRRVEQEQARAEQAQKLAEYESRRAEQEQARAEYERRRVEQEQARAEQAQKLAEYESRRAEQEQARAEYERRRVEQEQARAEQAQKLAEYESRRAEQEQARAEQAQKQAEQVQKLADLAEERAKRAEEKVARVEREMERLVETLHKLGVLPGPTD